MKLNRNALLPLIFTLSLLFFGCDKGPLRISVRYDTLGELRSNAQVYIEKTRIGHIETIISTEQGDYLVEVSIDPEHKGAATEHSRFFILDDPFDPDRKAIIIEQEPDRGKVLQNGSIVQGEKRQGVLGEFLRSLNKATEEASERIQESMRDFKESVSEGSRRLDEDLEITLGDIDSYFQEFGDSIDSYPNEEKLEQFRKSLDEFIEEFKSANNDLQNIIKNEVLPQLKRKLEELRNRLKDDGRNNEAEKIDHQINEILKI